MGIRPTTDPASSYGMPALDLGSVQRAEAPAEQIATSLYQVARHIQPLAAPAPGIFALLEDVQEVAARVLRGPPRGESVRKNLFP